MSGIRSKNTSLEIKVRKLLHGAGYRFRLHGKQLPGKPDIILPKWKTVIFVHGCFWHGHMHCPIYRLPKSNLEFWESKIQINRTRDKETISAYLLTEWKIIILWECAAKGRHKLSECEIKEKLSNAIGGSRKITEISPNYVA